MRWVVLNAKDPQRFEVMTAYLPAVPWDWCSELAVIVTKTVPGWQERVEHIKAIAKRNIPKWYVTVNTDGWVGSYLTDIDAPPALRHYALESIGIKVLLPLVVGEPFLFTDDDFVVLRNPEGLFGDDTWGSQSGMDKLAGGAQTRRHQEWCDAIGSTMTVDRFNAVRTDCGAYYFPYTPPTYLEDMLAFYAAPVSDESWEVGGNRRWTLDQRFMTHMLDSVVKAPHYVVFPYLEPKTKSLPRKASFLHYSANHKNGKAVWLKWLTDMEPTHSAADRERGIWTP